MPVGRPPKPVEVRRRAGNPGKRPLPEPKTALPAANGVPRTPNGLKTPGKRLWGQVWALGQAWLTPGLDYNTVELAARAFDEIADYRADLARYGRLLEEPIATPSGEIVGTRLVANPAEGMLRRAEKQLAGWLSALALTPTDRARLGLAQVKAQSKLEELTARRRQQA